jgi:hypothetical protein
MVGFFENKGKILGGWKGKKLNLGRGEIGGRAEKSYFLECCFWIFPSEYNTSNRNQQF